MKKQGYYCFIQQNKEGKLSMLNGGALKSLSYKNIDYYYQNMYEEIMYITPSEDINNNQENNVTEPVTNNSKYVNNYINEAKKILEQSDMNYLINDEWTSEEKLYIIFKNKI